MGSVIEIRTAKGEAEVREIARLWSRSFFRTSGKPDLVQGDKFVRVGETLGHGVCPRFWEAMHFDFVQLRLVRDLLLVASLDDKLVGFIAFSCPVKKRPYLTVQYLYVLPAGRLRGIGTRLYRAARAYAPDTPVRTTHTTLAWLDFSRALEANDDETRENDRTVVADENEG